MKKKIKVYKKKFAECLCGCGQKFRVFPSKAKEFASPRCFNSWLKMVMAHYKHTILFLKRSDEKKNR